jgi:hypothetical protein
MHRVGTLVYVSQMGGKRVNQTRRKSAYRSAMNEAMNELGLINEEATRVRNRMDRLDSVLEALKPFLSAAEDRSPTYKPVESANKPLAANGCTPQMIGIAIPDVVPHKLYESADPIQRRINSALGLSVA